MKKFLKVAILPLIFLNLFCFIGYPADKEDSSGKQSKQSDAQQSARPMLPPIVPSSSPGISPTPSPQIAAPLVASSVISASSYDLDASPCAIQTSCQYSTAQAVQPEGDVSAGLSYMPAAGNCAEELNEMQKCFKTQSNLQTENNADDNPACASD